MWWNWGVIGSAILVSGIIGLVLGRWWAVILSVVGWVVYVRVIYPALHPAVRLESGLREWVRTAGAFNTALTSGMVGAASMVGVISRKESKRKDW
jgi:hypothetical protein